MADVLLRRVRAPLDTISTLLLPVFFVITGLGVNIGAVSLTDLAELVAISVVVATGQNARPAWPCSPPHSPARYYPTTGPVPTHWRPNRKPPSRETPSAGLRQSRVPAA